MAYKNKYGITKIRSGRIDNLQINYDWDYNPKNHYPVLLFTPDMKKTDVHYHVPLNKKEAETLHKWLGEYLNDRKKKK